MEQYYHSSFTTVRGSEQQSSGKKSLILLCLDALMWVVMSICTFATFAAIISHYVSPEKLGVLSLCSLIAPVIFLVNIVLLLYWIVRGRWFSLVISTLVVISTLFYFPLYYQVSFKREYPKKYKERDYTRLLTYNIANGGQQHLVEYLDSIAPDILCVQEFLCDVEQKWITVFEDRYNTTLDTNRPFRCEIFSRYPILASGEIDSISRYNAVWADLLVGTDTARVINLHLQSTTISEADSRFINDYEYFSDNDADSKLRSIIARLKKNNILRAKQIENIKNFISATNKPIIICGDFNDVPLSYTYHELVADFNDAFRIGGRGYAYTFNQFFRLLRIDNVFVSPTVKVESYEVIDSIDYSDHYPIYTRLKFEDNTKQKKI